MAQCKHCGQSGLLLRTNTQGICKSCDAQVRERVEEERERIREALIFARCLKSAQDRMLHLRRAMDSVRVLTRYEKLGYCEIRPSPTALGAMIDERLEEVRLEQVGAGGGALQAAAPEPAVGSVRAAPRARPWERRREVRRRAGFPVGVEPGGIRATAEDVSDRGVRVSSTRLRRPGQRMRLTLHTAAGPVPAEGVVRWAQRPQAAGVDAGRVAMGFEFYDLPEQAVGLLRRAVPLPEPDRQ